jgi:hypothetical protein
MTKFSDLVYDKFKFNITKCKTIAGLSLAIYLSNFYNSVKTPLYISKGFIEKEIREAYYGGIVDHVIKYTDEICYKYDVNSHYPNAMINLGPMPGGKPRLSTEKNLDNIFGFVKAKVTAPIEKELKIAILPIKINGKVELFRGTKVGN